MIRKYLNVSTEVEFRQKLKKFWSVPDYFLMQFLAYYYYYGTCLVNTIKNLFPDTLAHSR